MRERTFTLSTAKTRFIRVNYGETARLAKTMDLRHARLSHYLCGRREIPESILMQLCKATNKKPSDYLENPAEKMLADSTFPLDN